MPNGDQPDDKVVRITLDGSGMPIPDQNRVKVKKDKQKVKWCADFAFQIQIEGSASTPSGTGGGDCAHVLKSGFFNQQAMTVIKYSIAANGKINDPEVEIEP